MTLRENPGSSQQNQTEQAKKELAQQMQREAVQIGIGLAQYLHSEGISRIAFVDRSARLAYLSLREAWHRLYPSERLPEIYFFNPDGFATKTHLSQPHELISEESSSPVPKALVVALKEAPDHLLNLPPNLFYSVISANAALIISRAPSDKREVADRLKRDFSRLTKDTQSPLLIFDTCRHTGNALNPIHEALESAGFSDVRIGLASHTRDYSNLPEPDFVALKGEAANLCYPFGEERIIEKTRDTLYGKRANLSPSERRLALERRDNIKEAFQLFCQSPESQQNQATALEMMQNRIRRIFNRS